MTRALSTFCHVLELKFGLANDLFDVVAVCTISDHGYALNSLFADQNAAMMTNNCIDMISVVIYCIQSYQDSHVPGGGS